MKHQTYWATCLDCDERVRELECEGLTTSDAQGVAQAEHMKAIAARLAREAQKRSQAARGAAGSHDADREDDLAG